MATATGANGATSATAWIDELAGGSISDYCVILPAVPEPLYNCHKFLGDFISLSVVGVLYAKILPRLSICGCHRIPTSAPLTNMIK